MTLPNRGEAKFATSLNFAGALACVLALISASLIFATGMGGGSLAWSVSLLAAVLFAAVTVFVLVASMRPEPRVMRNGTFLVQLTFVGAAAAALFALVTSIAAEVMRSSDTAGMSWFWSAVFTFAALVVTGVPLWIGLLGLLLKTAFFRT
ncbi:hypothetical protein D9V29_14100 [Mycetocola manganoxydans]|uniref:Uncharacterized protein n=1 Tax=Mycetocola manganoxydans TaxID=699879 RepID=A0A3L6ZMQ5_9MICO|nr:hypothetical protein [Mycetocola manganoxydans]RLP68282.1 hypothetical protein D9V29_14100 [Mycetocola manganoxydans]GHD52514.1 hypothetical protein GCM10008097_28470 [Mycetocola manganoxydans]